MWLCPQMKRKRHLKAILVLQSYFLVVYDWHSGRVLSFMDSQSEKMLLLYLQLTPCFHGGGINSTWARHVTPCPSALWGPRDQSSLRAWIPSQVEVSAIGRTHTSCLVA